MVLSLKRSPDNLSVGRHLSGFPRGEVPIPPGTVAGGAGDLHLPCSTGAPFLRVTVIALLASFSVRRARNNPGAIGRCPQGIPGDFFYTAACDDLTAQLKVTRLEVTTAYIVVTRVINRFVNNQHPESPRSIFPTLRRYSISSPSVSLCGNDGASFRHCPQVLLNNLICHLA